MQLECCINYLNKTNKLKLNDGKTELVMLASSHFGKHIGHLQLRIDKNLISPNVCAKNLCVFLDQHPNKKVHMANISKASNSLVLGISAKLITNLQRIQNIAARMVSKYRKHDYITALLTELH